MDDLTLFTQTLLDKKEKDYEQKLRAKDQELSEKLALELAALEQEKVKALEKIDANLSKQKEIQLQKIHNQTRNQALVFKQDQLLSLFEAAVGRMCQWDSEQTQAFFDAIVAQLPQGQFVLTLGDLTPPLQKIPDNMVLSQERIQQSAGFVFEQGGVVYNFLYERLMDELKADYMATLMAQLR